MKLEEREIARYLGNETLSLTAELREQAVLCQQELEKTVVPRTVTVRLSLCNFSHSSQNLAHHLRHCEEVFLYAITLGSDADRLLRRWSAQNMGKAAVGQAVCAVWLDELCDMLTLSFLPSLQKGEYLTPPFSPGYGDWSLKEQSYVLSLLDAPARIGLTLTNSRMLVPEKSITAVVGISRKKEDACGQKCLRCRKTDCIFR